jgi:hypothetical protein
MLERGHFKGYSCTIAGCQVAGMRGRGTQQLVFSSTTFSHINMRFFAAHQIGALPHNLGRICHFPAPFILLYLCIIFFYYVDSEQSHMVLCIA